MSFESRQSIVAIGHIPHAQPISRRGYLPTQLLESLIVALCANGCVVPSYQMRLTPGIEHQILLPHIVVRHISRSQSRLQHIKRTDQSRGLLVIIHTRHRIHKRERIGHALTQNIDRIAPFA